MSARTGLPSSSVRAIRPMRTAPAVWELEGPTITGPRISKMSVIASIPFIAAVSSRLNAPALPEHIKGAATETAAAANRAGPVSASPRFDPPG